MQKGVQGDIVLPYARLRCTDKCVISVIHTRKPLRGPVRIVSRKPGRYHKIQIGIPAAPNEEYDRQE